MDFFGFPKFVAEIDVAGEQRPSWEISERGEHVLTLSAAPLTGRRTREVDVRCRLWMDGEPQAATFRSRASGFASTMAVGAATLELGAGHRVGRALDAVLVSRRSIAAERCTSLEGILFGPERLTLPLMVRTLDAVDAAEERVGAEDAA